MAGRDEVRRWMRENGIKNADVARGAGITTSQVTYYLQGKRHSKKITQWLLDRGMPSDYLQCGYIDWERAARKYEDDGWSMRDCAAYLGVDKSSVQRKFAAMGVEACHRKSSMGGRQDPRMWKVKAFYNPWAEGDILCPPGVVATDPLMVAFDGPYQDALSNCGPEVFSQLGETRKIERAVR